jgi:rod shape-determining protein MreB
MSQYEGTLIDKISFLTAEQQERVLRFVEAIEAKEPPDKLLIQLRFDPFELRCIAKYGEKIFGHVGSSSNDDLVQKLCLYAKEQHHMLIGRPTAEKAIEEIGSIYPLSQERTYTIKGRNMDSGLPDSREISSIEVREQIAPILESQIRQFAANFKYLPHRIDQSEEILVGATIRLTGRYGSIRGLAEAVQQATGLKVVD